jgi:hypothetical protein
MIENIMLSYYNTFVRKKENEFIFLYLSKGLRNGIGFSSLLQVLISQYEQTLNDNRWNKYTLDDLNSLHLDITENGISVVDALFENNFLSASDREILKYSEKIYIGLEYLLTNNKTYNDMTWAILIFFLPALAVSTGYLIFQPEMKEFIYEMIKPIQNYSSTKFEVPPMFQDRSQFLILNFILYGTFISSFILIYLLKRFKPSFYFKYVPLAQSEFIVNNFSSIKNMLKTGTSLGKVFKTLKNNSSDKNSIDIFSELDEKLSKGDTSIYTTFEKYGFDRANISYLKIGAITGSLSKTLDVLVDYNEEKRVNTSKLMLKILPLSGEILMAIILLKPLIDIIVLTTTGVLNFTL